MQTPQKTQRLRPFKQRKSLDPANRAPSLVPAPERCALRLSRGGGECSPGDRFLPPLDRTTFLVPRELTATQSACLTVLWSRLVLGATEAFYLLVNNRSLVSMSVTMAEVYRDYRDEDGFVYVTYASQEMFGCSGSGRTPPSSPGRVKNPSSDAWRDGPPPGCEWRAAQ
uniref:Microtubule associated protein 1 light chain 3 gamma n=1 Tax=Ailuropoda melanoleuca TaxID=9646 RepID=G1M5R1_AILME